MAATQISDALAEVRDFLIEQKAQFWSDAELKALYRLGVNDLWGAILDLHGDHYARVSPPNTVHLPANSDQIAGVPNECFRILLIEPWDISASGAGRNCKFVPRKYNHEDFIAARTQSTDDPASTDIIYYYISGVGAPITAPMIYVAPQISADLPLRLLFCPTIDVVDQNPIPGQSDNALKAWTLAYALGKEEGQGARVPEPGWLQIYATEKQLMLTRLTPRQEQEPEVVDDFFRL